MTREQFYAILAHDPEALTLTKYFELVAKIKDSPCYTCSGLNCESCTRQQ